MKLVVLDGHTLNPGDLSWDELAAFGDLTVYERTSPEEVVPRAKEAEIVFTNKALVPRQAIEALPRLRYIGILATGMNVVDLEAAAERGITVRNVAGYSTPSVAQMVIAYILHFSSRVAEHSIGVHEGNWTTSIDFSYTDFPLSELAGKKLGIYGLGEIGRSVMSIGQAFGMQVIAFTRDPSKPAPAGVRWVDRDTLFAESDYLTLHCPLTPETEDLITKKTLSLMKSNAILINTGRGPLVVEEDLANALQEGRIAGAALDVLREEPPRSGSPLIGVQNCLITPHNAWATLEARQRLLKSTVDNLATWLASSR